MQNFTVQRRSDRGYSSDVDTMRPNRGSGAGTAHQGGNASNTSTGMRGRGGRGRTNNSRYHPGNYLFNWIHFQIEKKAEFLTLVRNTKTTFYPMIYTNLWQNNLFLFVDVQRQGSANDDFSGRNGHLPSKSYNERPGYNGGKWYNEKRGNSRRSEDLRSKSDFNYREQSGGRGGTTSSSSNKQRTERDVVSADRESNSSVENNNSRRRPKAKSTHNQSNSGRSIWMNQFPISRHIR